MDTRRITIDVPEKVLLAEKTDAEHFGKELAMLAAVKLYEMGRLSSGRAAELAGMNRVAFLSALERYQVFPMKAELEELEAEKAHAPRPLHAVSLLRLERRCAPYRSATATMIIPPSIGLVSTPREMMSVVAQAGAWTVRVTIMLPDVRTTDRAPLAVIHRLLVEKGAWTVVTARPDATVWYTSSPASTPQR